MEYIAPLIQTLLWVLLVAGIAWRFHKPIHALMEALADRVKSGSDVKAGPFSVTGMQPLAPPAQAARASDEIMKAYDAIIRSSTAYTSSPDSYSAPITAPRPTPAPATTSAPTPQFRAQYFQAEDLALRAVQAEFGQPINRQVTAGHDQGFDGAFVLNNRMNIVEVKYVSTKPPVAMMRAAIKNIQIAVKNYNWKSVNIIFVAVVDRTGDVESVREQLTTIADDSSIPTIVRVYALSELQTEFGVVDAG